MAKKRTINLMISEEADARLRALSAELKLAMGAIIEQAIMQWKPGTATPVESTPITDSIEARFNALEIRLQAIEAVGAVRVGAVGNECQGAAVVPVGVVPEPVANVGTEPGIDQGVTQKADMPTGKPSDAVAIIQDTEKFKAAVVTAYKSGITKGADILRYVTDMGYRNSNGNPYYRSGVADALKEAIRDGIIKG